MNDSAGSIIRRARVAARLTQSELARRSGVAQPHISNYEAGRHTPSFDTVRRIVRAAGGRIRVQIPVTLPDATEAARSLEAVLGLIDMLPADSRALRPGRTGFPRFPQGHP